MKSSPIRAVAYRKCKPCGVVSVVVAASTVGDCGWVCPGCSQRYGWLHGVVTMGLDRYFSNLSVSDAAEGI